MLTLRNWQVEKSELFIENIRTQSVELEDYCKFDELNTPCLYQCNKSDACGTPSYEFNHLSDEERLIVLDCHNKLRNDVAGGLYNENFIPPAQNMNALSYDKEAEFLAACFILQCLERHDVRRLSLEGDQMGQNIHHRYTTNDVKQGEAFLKNGIQRWFNEIRFVNESNYEDYINKYVPIRKAGHLSQVIWGKTKYVGCAKFHHRRKGHTYTLICNYLPAGNLVGGRIYTIGEPSCPDKNEEYPNLCGNIRPMDEDPFIFDFL